MKKNQRSVRRTFSFKQVLLYVKSFLRTVILILNRVAFFHFLSAAFITFSLAIAILIGSENILRNFQQYENLHLITVVTIVATWTIILIVIKSRQRKFPTKWTIAVIVSILFNFIFIPITFLFFAFNGMFDGMFTSKDFAQGDLQSIIGDRQIEPRGKLKSDDSSVAEFVSPDGKMIARTTHGSGVRKLELIQDGNVEEVLHRVNQSPGYYSWIQWTSDSQFLISCFDQWSSGSPTDPKHSTYCFVLNVQTKDYSLLPSTESFYGIFENVYSPDTNEHP